LLLYIEVPRHIVDVEDIYEVISMAKKRICWLLFILIGIKITLLTTSTRVLAYTPSAAAQQNGMKTDFTLLFWTIGIVGGCIAITLTYVSWRKYKGEEKKKKQQDNIID
jgi:lipid-A-disaccharide synthase-like uncharacterized protein